MEKISWTDRERNEEVLHRVKERNIIHTVKRSKFNSICHILRRNCHLKHFIKGKTEVKIEGKGRRERRRKELRDDLEGKKGYRRLKEEALNRTLRRTAFGRGLWTCRRTDCGMVVMWAGQNWHIITICDGTMKRRCEIMVPQERT